MPLSAAAQAQGNAEINFLAADANAPMSGQDLPQQGMVIELLEEALALAPRAVSHEVTWDPDRDSQLATVLDASSEVLGVPFFQPDCSAASASSLCTRLHFSEPLIRLPVMLFVRKDREFKFENDADVLGRTLCRPADHPTDDLDGYGRRWLSGNRVDLVRANNLTTCFELLNGGGVEAVAVDLFVGAHAIQEMGLRYDVVPLERPLSHQSLHVVTARDFPQGREQIDLIDAGLARLKKDPRYQEIVSRHLEAFLTGPEDVGAPSADSQVSAAPEDLPLRQEPEAEQADAVNEVQQTSAVAEVQTTTAVPEEQQANATLESQQATAAPEDQLASVEPETALPETVVPEFDGLANFQHLSEYVTPDHQVALPPIPSATEEEEIVILAAPDVAEAEAAPLEVAALDVVAPDEADPEPETRVAAATPEVSIDVTSSPRPIARPGNLIALAMAARADDAPTPVLQEEVIETAASTSERRGTLFGLRRRGSDDTTPRNASLTTRQPSESIVVVGVFDLGQETWGLFSLPSGEIRELRPGQAIGGVAIESIQGRSITVQSGAGPRTLRAGDSISVVLR